MANEKRGINDYVLHIIGGLITILLTVNLAMLQGITNRMSIVETKVEQTSKMLEKYIDHEARIRILEEKNR